MSDTLLMIVVLELLAILVVLITLALRFVQFGARLEKIAKLLSILGGIGHHGNRTRSVPFSIWCFTNDKWVLLTPCGQPGCDCGPPPAQPGSYEEQVIRKECPKR